MKGKDLGLGFEGGVKEMSRPIEVFNILPRKNKTRVHLKVDEAMEGCVRCTYRTVTYAKKLIPVYICYSQGNGFNAPLPGYKSARTIIGWYKSGRIIIGWYRSARITIGWYGF